MAQPVDSVSRPGRRSLGANSMNGDNASFRSAIQLHYLHHRYRLTHSIIPLPLGGGSVGSKTTSRSMFLGLDLGWPALMSVSATLLDIVSSQSGTHVERTTYHRADLYESPG